MKITDLTITYSAGFRGFSLEPAKTIEADGWNASTLHLYSHAGTHMDSPIHFNAGNLGIDEIPLEKCIAPCWVIDLTGIEPGSLINIQHLGNAKDKIQAGEGILLKTGWSQYVEQLGMYRNQLPRVSEELAHWCVSKGISIVGVEPPSIADVNNMEELTRVHQILLEAEITIVEGLTGLDQLESEKVQFIALPLKYKKGDGAPCRAIAIEGLLFNH